MGPQRLETLAFIHCVDRVEPASFVWYSNKQFVRVESSALIKPNGSPLAGGTQIRSFVLNGYCLHSPLEA